MGERGALLGTRIESGDLQFQLNATWAHGFFVRVPRVILTAMATIYVIVFIENGGQGGN